MPMPKRFLAVAFAAGALTLAACNNANINNLYGTPTPIPTATPTLTPNPQASTATVQVYFANSPLPNQPVTVSTANPNGNYGAPIATHTTDPTGKAIFQNLTPGANYCFYSAYTPPTPGALAEQAAPCSTLWGTFNPTINF